MKLTCMKCLKEIKSISITKQLMFRADYDLNHNIFTETDREYLGPDNMVRSLDYKCDCYPNGVQFNFRFDENIQDFIGDVDWIPPNDLKHPRYGNLIVTKE